MVTQRWIVTYTKHVKQKRKIFQDGTLELCSSSNTVLLYDDCEKLIDRRFLKKDEIVKSGDSLSFETHIVEIGDHYESNKPSLESNVKSGTQSESQKEKLCVEWNILYTTQKTQKTKRYQDGVLRLSACSSHSNLITLLNEDGSILSSMHLKSVACLETGNNCEFPNYLVEICERRVCAAIPEDSSNIRSCKSLLENGLMNQVSPSKPKKCDILGSSKKLCKFALQNDLEKNRSMKVAKNCNSETCNFTSSTAVPLRNVSQILSVLEKPSPEGGASISGASTSQCARE